MAANTNPEAVRRRLASDRIVRHFRGVVLDPQVRSCAACGLAIAVFRAGDRYDVDAALVTRLDSPHACGGGNER